MEIEKVLSNIRSEHIGMDVWNEFVVPFNIQMSDFHNLLPIKLEGSRGSGKNYDFKISIPLLPILY